MKKFIAMLLALAMVLSLAACGSKTDAPAETKAQTAAEKPAATEKAEEPAPAAEPVTLTWGSWSFAEESIRHIYQEAADLYNETNEYNTTISTEYFYSYADYLSTLLIDVAGGNGPDVAHIKAEWLPQLLALGVVKPLDGYISADVLADYSQSAIDSVTVDGSMMALPWFSNTYALLVNTDLCEQAGVDYTAIASWDDLLAAAVKISALGSDIYGLAIPDSNGVEAGEGYNTFPALWARGGEFEKDGTIMLTSDESVAAYTDLQNLFVKKISTAAGANSFKELRNLFGAGKIGFYWDIESGIATAASAAEDEAAYYARTQAMTIPGADAAKQIDGVRRPLDLRTIDRCVLLQIANHRLGLEIDKIVKAKENQRSQHSEEALVFQLHTDLRHDPAQGARKGQNKDGNQQHQQNRARHRRSTGCSDDPVDDHRREQHHAGIH